MTANRFLFIPSVILGAVVMLGCENSDIEQHSHDRSHEHGHDHSHGHSHHHASNGSEVTYHQHSDANSTPAIGPNVRFRSDYDQTTEPGEIENFTLTIDSGYSSGSIDIKLVASEGLELLSGDEIRLSLTDDEIEIPIRLQALQAGRYHLKYLVNVDTEGALAPIPAVSGMVVRVGSGGRVGSPNQDDLPHQPLRAAPGEQAEPSESSEPVVSMPAQEIIR